ncbi:hypothetical protein CPB86DRAFT_259097 [Serendipita vermifera]|nr:hypothetical protein CPB86DRAFT_259097 [Serendipita vermifera]
MCARASNSLRALLDRARASSWAPSLPPSMSTSLRPSRVQKPVPSSRTTGIEMCPNVKENCRGGRCVFLLTSCQYVHPTLWTDRRSLYCIHVLYLTSSLKKGNDSSRVGMSNAKGKAKNPSEEELFCVKMYSVATVFQSLIYK